MNKLKKVNYTKLVEVYRKEIAQGINIEDNEFFLFFALLYKMGFEPVSIKVKNEVIV